MKRNIIVALTMAEILAVLVFVPYWAGRSINCIIKISWVNGYFDYWCLGWNGTIIIAAIIALCVISSYVIYCISCDVADKILGKE